MKDVKEKMSGMGVFSIEFFSAFLGCFKNPMEAMDLLRNWAEINSVGEAYEMIETLQKDLTRLELSEGADINDHLKTLRHIVTETNIQQEVDRLLKLGFAFMVRKNPE